MLPLKIRPWERDLLKTKLPRIPLMTWSLILSKPQLLSMRQEIHLRTKSSLEIQKAASSKKMTQNSSLPFLSPTLSLFRPRMNRRRTFHSPQRVVQSSNSLRICRFRSPKFPSWKWLRLRKRRSYQLKLSLKNIRDLLTLEARRRRKSRRRL